jgi:hypothetical protein
MAQETFEKNISGWNNTVNDFRGENEIMVTITLNEYRKLVTISATAEQKIEDANADKYKREQEIKALREQLEIAERKLCGLSIGG